MLVYLDNAQSTAAADEPTTMQDEIRRMPRRARLGGQGGGRFGGGGRGVVFGARPSAGPRAATADANANDPKKRAQAAAASTRTTPAS